MATAAALKKQAERAEAKAAYIKNAEVSLHGDHATVTSEFDENERYRVAIECGMPVACNCKDYYWRSKRDPQHKCKHMQAVDQALDASLPVLIADMARIFKAPRRSAARAAVVASLQVKEGVRVRKTRGANALSVIVPKDVQEVTAIAA